MSEGDRVGDEPPAWGQLPAPIRAACVILVLESLALLSVAGFDVVATVAEHADSVGRALAGAGVALFGALVLGVGARGIARLSPAARTPVVVIQLLALPVSYTLAFQAGRALYGGPILVAAVAVIYLLFTPPARDALDRDPPL